MDEIIAQEVSQLRIKICLLTKQSTIIGEEKVNVVGTRGKTSRNKKSNFDEEAKYLDRKMVCFQEKG